MTLELQVGTPPLWAASGTRFRAIRAWTEREAARELANRIVRRKYGVRAFARLESTGPGWMVEGWQTTRHDPNTSVRVGRPFVLVLVEVKP